MASPGCRLCFPNPCSAWQAEPPTAEVQQQQNRKRPRPQAPHVTGAGKSESERPAAEEAARSAGVPGRGPGGEKKPSFEARRRSAPLGAPGSARPSSVSSEPRPSPLGVFFSVTSCALSEFCLQVAFLQAGHCKGISGVRCACALGRGAPASVGGGHGPDTGASGQAPGPSLGFFGSSGCGSPVITGGLSGRSSTRRTGSIYSLQQAGGCDGCSLQHRGIERPDPEVVIALREGRTGGKGSLTARWAH